MPCEECGGLPCREGCYTVDVNARLALLFALPVCVHGVVTIDPCEDCATAYRKSCEATRAALGIG